MKFVGACWRGEKKTSTRIPKVNLSGFEKKYDSIFDDE